MKKALIAIPLAIVITAIMAACGSSPPATQAAATTTGSAATGPATTAPASTAAAATGPATTAAAAAIAVTVPAWCINPRLVTAPGTLAEWLASDGYIEAGYVQDGLVELLAPYSTNATENADNRSFCQNIGFAKYAPPPVDVAGYTVALDDAIRASIIVNNGTNAGNAGAGEQPALAAAHPYLMAAETALKAFFAAVGHPVG
jgi:hypothetical protein